VGIGFTLNLLLLGILLLPHGGLTAQRLSFKVYIYEKCLWIDTAKVDVYSKSEQKPKIIRQENNFILIYDSIAVCYQDSFIIRYQNKDYRIRLHKDSFYHNLKLYIRTDYSSATEDGQNERWVKGIINFESLTKRRFTNAIDYFFSNGAMPFRMFNH